MRWLAYILLALTTLPPALANDSMPLLYSRSNIMIVRQSAPALPWQSETKPGKADVLFDAEIRDGATLYNQQGWYNLTGPDEKKAVMLIFGSPVLAPIIPSASYAPVDILLLDKEGTVLQIFPKLQLATLQEELYPEKPITAFLFLKGGACESLSITPGDYVQYKTFKRPPATIAAPPSS